jgi:hypothetical protein
MRLWVDTIWRPNPRVPPYGALTEKLRAQRRSRAEAIARRDEFRGIAQTAAREYRGADVDHDDLLSSQSKRSDSQASTEAGGSPQPKRADTQASTEAGGSPQPQRADTLASTEAGGSPQSQRADTQASTEAGGSPQPQVTEEAPASSQMCQASGILGLPTCWFQLASGR